ncbi:hypothetical protein A7D00_3077 [Trichophyton violaceum]|uniref:Uncharacterized protein n=1 Tax=Trichophyton violaceum TaxID=34388 RepID=A0A178FL83_TRIVO|nr:hypothetical protein A7D00_3077 [Trichophyton violaceum]
MIAQIWLEASGDPLTRDLNFFPLPIVTLQPRIIVTRLPGPDNLAASLKPHPSVLFEFEALSPVFFAEISNMTSHGPNEEFVCERRRELLSSLQDLLRRIQPQGISSTTWAGLWLADIEILEALLDPNQRTELFKLLDHQTENVALLWQQLDPWKSRSPSPSAPQSPLASPRGSPSQSSPLHRSTIERQAGLHRDVHEDEQAPQPTSQPATPPAKRQRRDSDRSSTARRQCLMRIVRRSDDGNEFTVKFYWLPLRKPAAQGVDLLTDPTIPEDLVGIAKDYRAWNTFTGEEIASGREIVLTTRDPENLPLPSWDLLDPQWTLQRLVALRGAADVFADTVDDDDSSGIMWEDEDENVRHRDSIASSSDQEIEPLSLSPQAPKVVSTTSNVIDVPADDQALA